ncbi:60S ribosomal export protein nmd3 [Durusdinium trenchii]|uniref:60S ribosomal export protein nmd3 n=1 Tax=Durusdinium trenchii TaxID=1381693 RepID=A0ABP0MCP2_9DINO
MFTKPRGGLKQSPTAPLWPMPLPYHFGRQSLDCDGDELAFRKAINLQVGYLNFLHLNRCVTPPWWICGPRPLTSGQQDVISRLRRLSGAWKKMGVIKADAMGRVAAKQERQEEVLRELLVFAESNVADVKKYQKSRCRIQNGKPVNERVKVVGKLSKGDMTGAQVIVADRIKMEGRPVFDPLPFLDEKSKRLYEDPLSCGIAPSIPDLCPPRVRVHADLDEKVKLLRLLESTGRLGFRSKADIVEGFGNGLFCVPKSTKVDRLILDGRPANLLQSPPNQFIMTMASPNAILGMHLLPGEKLLMTGDDLSNFFYTFRVNERRISRNFLDWKIPIYVAKGFSSFPEALQEEPYVYACLASLAMGDSAACEYAQTSHLAMALQCGALQSHELLTIHGKTPRCNTVGGIIIDDFCLLEKVPIDSSDSPDSNDRRSRMHDMYTKVGLQAHPDKGFSQQEVASFWGADVDGLEGLVRGTLIRAASLVWVTAEVAKLGVCSISLLEVLAGGFVSLFGFRRRMLCLLDYVYSLQGGRNQRDIISLPKPAIDELWSLVILCPLAVTDLRANFSDRIFMVDASNWGDAVVSAELSAGLQSEMHRHSLSRSCWTKMLTPFKAMLRGKGTLSPNDELPGDEEPFTEHPVWEVAARGLNYKLDWKQRAKNGRHINLGELRSYLKAESLSSASCGGDVRVAIGSDSQAKNPGPRKVAARKEKDPLDLDNVELIRPQTNAIGRANWEKFLVWAKGEINDAEADDTAGGDDEGGEEEELEDDQPIEVHEMEATEAPDPALAAAETAATASPGERPTPRESQPPAEPTPEKVLNNANNFHSVKVESDGYECRLCSAFAPDLNLLKSVPCVRGDSSSTSKKSNAGALREELDKLKKLKELQKLQNHYAWLLDQQKSSRGLPKSFVPATGIDNVDTQLISPEKTEKTIHVREESPQSVATTVQKGSIWAPTPDSVLAEEAAVKAEEAPAEHDGPAIEQPAALEKPKESDQGTEMVPVEVNSHQTETKPDAPKEKLGETPTAVMAAATPTGVAEDQPKADESAEPGKGTSQSEASREEQQEIDGPKEGTDHDDRSKKPSPTMPVAPEGLKKIDPIGPKDQIEEEEPKEHDQPEEDQPEAEVKDEKKTSAENEQRRPEEPRAGASARAKAAEAKAGRVRRAKAAPKQAAKAKAAPVAGSKRGHKDSDSKSKASKKSSAYHAAVKAGRAAGKSEDECKELGRICSRGVNVVQGSAELARG